MKQSKEGDAGSAGIGVFVNGNGFTHTVIRVVVNKGDNVLEKLATTVDQLMGQFFPSG